MSIPDGFLRFDRASPYLDLIGPLYMRSDGERLTLGMAVEERHCNRRGTAHGGLLTSLADVALGYAAGHGAEDGRQLTTAALSVQFLGAAHLGDWVESTAEILKLGSRIAYATCFLTAKHHRIVQASGIFSVR